jgi:chorismate synthase
MWQGEKLKLTVFGESHGEAIGCVIEGLPAGEAIDAECLAAFMARRAPGQHLSTPRKEPDEVIFLSGITKNRTNGFPLCIMIKNTNVRSADYDNLRDTPRPGHADYTTSIKYRGYTDMRGGGHFSGRLTAPICAAGGIVLQILERMGITVAAKLIGAGGVFGSAEQIMQVIESAANEGDSVGGVVRCVIGGMPAGKGGPLFEGMEGRLAQVMFAIPAVKGVEFGSGFAGANSRGSENNSAFVITEGKITTETNHHGGILGGITTGEEIVMNVAFKPTPSISKPQQTVNLRDLTPETLIIKGRHDPCVALRGVPVTEAAAALVVADCVI